MSPDEARAVMAARPKGHGKGRRPMSVEEKVTRRKVASKAQNAAYVSLKALHEDEYRVLYQTALVDLLAEAGLP